MIVGRQRIYYTGYITVVQLAQVGRPQETGVQVC